MTDKILPRKKPTQVDVAKAAGVSQTTVSLVLNDPDISSVPPETRHKVLAAIQALGYVPNTAARALRTNKSYSLACVIPSITNPFYPEFISGVQSVAEENGYEVIVYNTYARHEKELKVLQAVQQGRDGVVGVFFHAKATELYPLLEQNIAVVRLENKWHVAGDWPLDNLYVDNAAAACQAASYLIERHRCQVIMFTGTDGPRLARTEGYRRALAAHSPPVPERVLVAESYDERGGYLCMQQMLQEPGCLPAAVFAANDLMALGAMKAVRQAGLRIPQDLAIVGFDDIPAAELVTPSLTTVRQFQERLGRRATELIFERLSGEAPAGGRTEEMPFELVIRESA
jgi:LacI family transcriptional regulator